MHYDTQNDAKDKKLEQVLIKQPERGSGVNHVFRVTFPICISHFPFHLALHFLTSFKLHVYL